jgi:hypothetical protein
MYDRFAKGIVPITIGMELFFTHRLKKGVAKKAGM